MPAGRFNTMAEGLEQANQILVGCMTAADADLDFLTDLIAKITDELRSPFAGKNGQMAPPPGGGPGGPGPGGPGGGVPPEIQALLAGGPGQTPAQGIPGGGGPPPGMPPGLMPGVAPPNPDELRRTMSPPAA